jgi:hypothetical protein
VKPGRQFALSAAVQTCYSCWVKGGFFPGFFPKVLLPW